MARRAADPCEEYAKGVVSGKIVAGRLVRLACERHLRDRREGGARGLHFDGESAWHAIDFFSFLRIPGADGSLSEFRLEPFQQFIVGSLFGWKKSNGARRFRTAYVEIGKGNGKSPMGAGVGLYLLVAEGKREAEIYSAAVTRDQAGIAFRDARNMALGSPFLAGILDIGQHNIAYLPTASFFRPVSSEHRGLDGKRVQGAIIDEIHEHPTPMVVDKIGAGTKRNKSALILEITNSGYNRQSVCFEHHELSRKILEGAEENDAWFAYVCTLDPCQLHADEGKHQPVDGCAKCDDWRNPDVWAKANPGLGTILPKSYLEEQVRLGVSMASREGIVKRLNFCTWTEQVTQWLSAHLWDKGGHLVDAESLRGAVCFGGLDLASKLDVTALVLCFREDLPEPDAVASVGDKKTDEDKPKTNAIYRLLPFFWIPEDRAREREQKDRVPWSKWRDQGFVFFTHGNVVDYNEIQAFIQDKLFPKYHIEEIAYDPWNATQMAVNLESFGIKMIEFGQSLRNFNEPTKEFERLLMVSRLLHGGHPVLSWMAGNVSALTDASGNIRPVKPDHTDHRKVDGIVAAIMALARAMTSQGVSCGIEVW